MQHMRTLSVTQSCCSTWTHGASIPLLTLTRPSRVRSGLDSQLPPPDPSVGTKRKLTFTVADMQQRSKRQKLLLEKRKDKERAAGKAHRLRITAEG